MFFIPYGTEESESRITFPYVNVVIVIINILVFSFELYVLNTAGEAGFEKLIQDYAFIPASLNDNLFQISLLTAMFMHAGLLHLIGNMIYLLPFGDNVEHRLGHLKYLLFYLVCGIVATLVYAAFHSGSTIPLLGASGAIAGVLGGYIALHPMRSTVKGIIFAIIILPVRLPALIFVGYWFIIQLFSTVASLGVGQAAAESGGVAFLAHVAGFIAGLIFAPLLVNAQPSYTED